MKHDVLDGMMRLVNFHLGGSLYLVAAVALAGGALNMTLLLTVCAMLTYVVYQNIADVAVQHQTGSLCRLVQSVLGRGAALVLRVLVVLNALGVVVSYSRICFDIHTGVVHAAATGTALAAFVTTLVVGCAAVPALEMCCPDLADWGSLMSNAALLVLLGALFWLPPASSTGMPLPEPRSLWDLAISFGPSLVFAFSSAEYVLLACGVSDGNGVLVPGADVHGKVRFVGTGSLLISLCLYVVVGYGGLRAFGLGVQDDILKNFALDRQPDNQLLSAIVLGTNAVSLLLSLPVFAETFLLYLRELIQEALPEGAFNRFKEPSSLGSWLVNPAHPGIGCAWVVPVALAMAYRATSLFSVINLMGACTDYAFMFVFPGLAFCRCFKISQYPLRWAADFVLLVGSLYLGYHSFVQEWHAL